MLISVSLLSVLIFQFVNIQHLQFYFGRGESNGDNYKNIQCVGWGTDASKDNYYIL